jgi:hypothetical protein
MGVTIEEGRAASKSHHSTFGYFLSISQQDFLLISFKIHLLESSPQKQKEQRQKQLDVSFSDVFSLPVHFEFLQSSLTVYILPSFSAC